MFVADELARVIFFLYDVPLLFVIFDVYSKGGNLFVKVAQVLFWYRRKHHALSFVHGMIKFPVDNI